jgi:hypothetical protein
MALKEKEKNMVVDPLLNCQGQQEINKILLYCPLCKVTLTVSLTIMKYYTGCLQVDNMIVINSGYATSAVHKVVNDFLITFSPKRLCTMLIINIFLT